MAAHSAVLQENTHKDTVDEYYYGYRTVIEHDKKGKTVFRYVPLAPEDFLDPEEGDVYMQGTLHTEDVGKLASIFRFHLKEHGNITVYSDLKIEWGIEGLKNPAPDISIFEDVKDPSKPRGVFSVPEEGVKPFFVLEVISPRYRKEDIEKKPAIYRKAGVSEYIIVDPGLKNNEISYTLKGYRLLGGRYVKIKPDKKGRIRSKTANIRMGVSESGDRLIIEDGITGELLLCDTERAEAEAEARKQAEIRADKADEELRLLKAKLRALEISAE
ncbi:MAG: Uma2 family endonuclease [Desulfobacterales bacterium]|nr:Uma2 family endonuclease [Desulfobacterales bacterium]